MAWAIYDKAPSTPNPSTTEADPFDSPSAAVVVDPAASDPSLIPLPASPGRNRASPYVQGMNVLAAPLLYVSRSEPQAFTLLHTLLTREIPSYVLPTMSGVHTGLSLLDCCLSILDPQLHTHLTSHSLHASTYAFPPIATLSACTPPLPEVLKLWDFFFAYGVHLNVLAVAAQLIMMRERLLGSESPGRELRTLDRLDSRKVVEMVLSFVGKVGGTVYKEIAAHTHTK
jgi:cell cycle arrest protein BUB2